MVSPPFSPEGTIVALASAPGRAGVAVLRVSGEKASQVVTKLCVPSILPEPRKAALRTLRDPETGETLDHALVLWFPAPASFTGENVVELHLHGGRAIIAAALKTLCSLDGFRLAEAGAFSRRAFENGKLDLTEAEGIADLVDAETAAQRRQALRQMEGDLGRLYQNWAERLTHRLAFIEAEIDFADEELPPEITAQRLDDLRLLEKEITTHLDDRHRGEKLREGFVVALLGAPNAGKSSLLNALARREAAIVASTPGTTRDVIEVQLDLGGYPVTLADTAGLRETVDAIESEGVRRALARAEQADFKILVFDGSEHPALDPKTKALCDDASLVVVNKKDLLSSPPPLAQKGEIFVSAKTGEGLAALTQKLTHEIDKRFTGDGAPALTRARHRAALEEALDHLRRALASGEQTELCAEDLRLAVRALGRITGQVDVEDLLDIIFSTFCIGK
jgi:tRNA modification GTPase